MEDAVAGTTSVLVTWNPDQTSPEQVRQALHQRLAQVASRARLPRGRLHLIPVVYGGPFGPDLDWVAATAGLSPQEVVQLHVQATYRVWMVGFLPGFAYMGPVDSRLALVRRATPRVRVPAGSVAIAGGMTGIYPVDSPGGWHVIGRTWVRLWEPRRRSPALLRPGDRVRFVAVSVEQAPAGWAEEAARSWESAESA
jgi:KipI family sensor histidine kinase inhibitor